MKTFHFYAYHPEIAFKNNYLEKSFVLIEM